MSRTSLTGLTLDELRTFVMDLGEKPYRAHQLFAWLYKNGVNAFSDMSDLSRDFRDVLERVAVPGSLELLTTRRSTRDGTTKFLLRLPDDLAIEAVLIPPDADAPDVERRLTLCVSTQVGCPLDCAFCATGTMGFSRNLSAGEIVEQYLYARRNTDRRISNIVFMGMGEPMLNYDEVMKAVGILTDNRGAHLGARRITISTAGYVNQIRRLADEDRTVKLALSLHSLDEAKRTALMPITKKHGITALTDALEYYYRRTRIRPTLEYIPFEGFNDTDADADLLIRFARRVPCKVNLIPFHSIEFTRPSGFAAQLRPSSGARIEAFASRLRDAHLTVMVRSSAGEDIEAACGQLAVAESASPRRLHVRAPRTPASSHP
ncbi:MAG: 23S rRNA (adenine(2503)-C(2))-methyltransferase RlmN [Bacteroidetes bacterium]|jgi:23S rRNA (adenine2503-C2)-methyltransferase|nr:23S rRNA (adenine(2503)-C(2))-methyltransferase RlmN [Bacteroidota bacterium]